MVREVTITSAAEADAADPSLRMRLALLQAISLGGIVFAASMLGILSRPSGFLAVFWPANPLLLGLLARNPGLATPGGWIAAALGYLAADMATGGRGMDVFSLAAANLGGVAAGYLLLRNLPADDLQLRRPLSMMYFFFICVIAALVSALIGYNAVPDLIDARPLPGLAFWVTTELVNNIMLLPVILSAPAGAAWLARLFLAGPQRLDQAGSEPLALSRRSLRKRLLHLRPLLALLGSVTISLVVGGAGAIAFPVPALLWCALVYSLFSTTVVTLGLCVFMLMAISTGWVDVPQLADPTLSTMSVRLGICLLALGPLTVASINSARNDLISELDRAVSFDFLTGALTRSALMKRATRVLDQSAHGGRPIAVLMLDVDHFKRINDGHGHDAGDQALIVFARTVADRLHERHLFGRFGGDEFAVVMPGTTRESATQLADSLQSAIAQAPVALACGKVVRVTASIGLAVHEHSGPVALESLLKRADDAMYRAKIEGRDRVRV